MKLKLKEFDKYLNLYGKLYAKGKIEHKEFEEMSEINVATLWRWRTGKSKPHYKSFEKFKKAVDQIRKEA